MIPKECKRLAEVDFPIAVVSKHAARESAARSGHPRTLHLWWARRPLGACRSMLMALLLPDPCDSHCPGDFKTEARKLLSQLGTIGKSDAELRNKLLRFIGEFADWGLSSDRTYLEIARGLLKAAHPEDIPVVVDTFAGGGSIPVEALRIGCDAFASDLNPVACLILKVLIEDIPRHGADLADELRRAGTQIKDSVETEFSRLYPTDPDGALPLVYLWARTVRCESPNCGAEIPLIRSFWLCKKESKKHALRYHVLRPNAAPPSLKFEIYRPTDTASIQKPTVSQAKATCPCCNTTLRPDRVRDQLSRQHGGAHVIFDEQGRRVGGALLLAVVTTKPNEPGRGYRIARDEDYAPILLAEARLHDLNASGSDKSTAPWPTEEISLNEIRRVSVPLYGATRWGDLFAQRQKLYLVNVANQISQYNKSDAVQRLAALVLDRLVMLLSAHCRWKPTGESLIDMFGRHAIGMVWDFAEGSPRTLNLWENWITEIARFIERAGAVRASAGQAMQADATRVPLPDDSVALWFTDPPYYDSIPYAHLADCFFVWLKRALRNNNVGLGFEQLLINKDQECVVDRPHRLSNSTKDERFFEKKISAAAQEARRFVNPSGIASIVFAHKTTEGWEALLSGITNAGWFITASWPVATELATRLNARDTASLETSVHLVCRPRPEDAPIGDWGEVLRQLPPRVADWIERLQEEGVRGADLVFACIGPALEIFSRYSNVETAEGREVTLAEYLEKVWEVVGRTALEQVLGTAEAKARNGGAGAVEEDARLTALFLWTLQSTNGQNGEAQSRNPDEPRDEDTDDEDDDDAPSKPSKGYTLIFDVVRRFAQPLGIHLEDWEARIIETKKGVVRLLAVSERAKQLFGEDGASAVADRIESDAHAARTTQMMLFPEAEPTPQVRGRGRGRRPAASDGQGAAITDESLRTRREATTLDRVHAAMLLQASGRANALRTLLKAEQERGPDFMRLCNALTRLYPRDSEEKRLLDAMLLAVPR